VSAPTPGSAEWLRFMTASKIAAVVGTSPYESRFSLWHRMHGDLGPQEQTAAMTYGHYLEPVLLRWFADQHPGFAVRAGEWVERDGWAGATPDGTFVNTARGDETGLVQCKTSRLAWEWEQGVPPGYYDQIQWEMWVTGDVVCYLVADVLMEFREFRIERDEERIDYLVTEARAFMDSLAYNQAPPIDGSTHTYIAVRELHPEIDPEDVDVPGDLAVRWLDARESLATWTEAEQQAKTEIAALMGNARRAMWDGRPLFTRQARNGGTPYLVAARNLPTGAAA
jgi:putative phage-type endonuclease